MFWVILGELYRVLVSSPEIWSISPSPSSPARISQLQNPLTRRVIRERPFPSLTPSFVCLKVWFPAYSFFFFFHSVGKYYRVWREFCLHLVQSVSLVHLRRDGLWNYWFYFYSLSVFISSFLEDSLEPSGSRNINYYIWAFMSRC